MKGWRPWPQLPRGGTRPRVVPAAGAPTERPSVGMEQRWAAFHSSHAAHARPAAALAGSPTAGRAHASRASRRLGLSGGYQGRERRGLDGHGLQVGNTHLCSVQYLWLWPSTGVAPALPTPLAAAETFSSVLFQKGHSAWCCSRKPCGAFANCASLTRHL